MVIRNVVSAKVEHSKFEYNNGKRPYLEDRNTKFHNTNSGVSVCCMMLFKCWSSIEDCVFINCSADDPIIESNQQNYSDNDSLFESDQQNCSANESLPESSHLPYTYVSFGHGGALFIFLTMQGH